MNLVLYAYLPDLDNRTRTISELDTEINKPFTAAGIDIPNPQLDLNLHSEKDSNRGVNCASTDDEENENGPK